jgi:hypothetical protein
MEGTVQVEKYIDCDDNRLNYCFVKKEELVNPNKDLNVDWINQEGRVFDRDKIDYGIVLKKGKPETEGDVGTLDTTIPSSLLAINTQEEAIEWYKDKHPNLPDGFAEILARYHFKEAEDVKHAKEKKDKKKWRKKKKHQNKMKVRQGKFSVLFD